MHRRGPDEEVTRYKLLGESLNAAIYNGEDRNADNRHLLAARPIPAHRANGRQQRHAREVRVEFAGTGKLQGTCAARQIPTRRDVPCLTLHCRRPARPRPFVFAAQETPHTTTSESLRHLTPLDSFPSSFHCLAPRPPQPKHHLSEAVTPSSLGR
jgi:hypothetical protein